jgi:endo-1,4-beta-xylanase
VTGNGIPRRTVIGGLAAGVAATSLNGCGAGPALSTALSQTDDGLAALGRAKGLLIGTCAEWAPGGGPDIGGFANPAYAALAARDCSLIVAENMMKVQAIRPAADRFDFTGADNIVRQSVAAGMAVRGHCLWWMRPQWLPAWLNNLNFGFQPATHAAAIITDHVSTVVPRYGNQLLGWDVVNEAVDPATGDIVETALTRALGDPVAPIDIAFRAARAAEPGMELAYNDYMSWEPGNERHRAGVLRLLAELRRRGTPVDALGIQSHLSVTDPTRATGTVAGQERDWRDFLEQVRAMGYRPIITELDVDDRALVTDVARRDAGVAAYTEAYLDIMLAEPGLRHILFWGLTDRYSWLQSFRPRGDSAPQRCCPYDQNYQPKPMRQAVARAIGRAAAR